MSRKRIKEFCLDFLAGCCSHMLPVRYRDELLLIDIELTKENIEPTLKRIFKNVLYDAVGLGRVVNVLGFAEVLHQHYFWYCVNILVEILSDVLEEFCIHPDSLTVENCLTYKHTHSDR